MQTLVAKVIELVKRSTTKLIWHFSDFSTFFRIFQSSLKRKEEAQTVLQKGPRKDLNHCSRVPMAMTGGGEALSGRILARGGQGKKGNEGEMREGGEPHLWVPRMGFGDGRTRWRGGTAVRRRGRQC